MVPLFSEMKRPQIPISPREIYIHFPRILHPIFAEVTPPTEYFWLLNFWPRALLKGPKRSFVVVVVFFFLLETWVKNGKNGTKNVPKGAIKIFEIFKAWNSIDNDKCSRKEFVPNRTKNIRNKNCPKLNLKSWFQSDTKPMHWLIVSWPFVAM